MRHETVRVSLKSIIDNLSETGLPSDDREISESTAVGTLLLSERGALISFTENSEGGEIRTRIEITGRSVHVCRHGAIESDILFTEGISHSSIYGAPPYTFDMSVFTRRIRGNIEKDGRVDIFYDMEIGGAKKSVKMTLTCEI